MATVKIGLQNDETIDQAEEILLKALSFKARGGDHDSQKFHDPALLNLELQLENLFKKEYEQMLEEINSELEKG